MTEAYDETSLAELTAGIVSAYVGNNKIIAADLPEIIEMIGGALAQAAARPAVPVREPLKPAVPIKKSVTPDFIVCLEDGKKFKSLKRHIGTYYDLSPEEYRDKWGLPHDYPMVAPNYAAARSKLAKSFGLGQRRRAK